MPSRPSSRDRIDQLLDFLREALEPSVGVDNPPARARTGKGREAAIVWQAFMSQLAQVRNLAILRSGRRPARPTLPPEGSESPSEIEPAFMIEFWAAIARETLDMCLPHLGNPEDPDSAWDALQATLLLAVQFRLFWDVTPGEREAALRRVAARLVRRWDTTPSRTSDDARQSLRELQEDFDIDRLTAWWVAVTAGIDRALPRWSEPRRIRPDRPWAYWYGETSALPLLGLDEVGLVEDRYHRDEDRRKPVHGIRIVVNDFRRRVRAETEDWLELYGRNPKEALEQAALATSDPDQTDPPKKSRPFRLLITDPEALEREQRHLRRLFTAADARLTIPEQRQAAEQLVTELFPRPIHRSRWSAVVDRFGSTDDATEATQEAAAGSLLEAIWRAGQEQAWADYPELVDYLRPFVSHRTLKDVLGPRCWDLTETREGKAREPLLEDLAADRAAHDVTHLEAAVSEVGDLCRERFESDLRQEELREELAVFLRKATDQERALWRVMKAVIEDEDRDNLSEGYRRFVRRYPEHPAASSKSTFQRRWEELEQKLGRRLMAG